MCDKLSHKKKKSRINYEVITFYIQKVNSKPQYDIMLLKNNPLTIIQHSNSGTEGERG